MARQRRFVPEVCTKHKLRIRQMNPTVTLHNSKPGFLNMPVVLPIISHRLLDSVTFPIHQHQLHSMLCQSHQDGLKLVAKVR